ncbi:hypothetical protein DH2020_040098 [Rehmannia glutinosa]|uniref:Uncharacterized protein n=1 Tax=Rehmannia glutinosa TaxID=99300 RepID=A0ABR0UW06_REHGL
MEGEDNVRTVDCLRGRLLAERLASRNANEEAEQLGNKLMDLETLLKQEAKSRNRAEKKLKSLMKKLESMNISHISDESEYSGSVGKSDISSLSSTTSSTTKENIFGNQENAKSEKGSEKNLSENDSKNSLLSVSDYSSASEGSSSSGLDVNLPEIEGQECKMGINGDDAHSENSSHLGSNQSSKMDEQSDISYHSVRSGVNKEDDEDDGRVDNSMALVTVDAPQKNQTVDPEVLDSTVKEVLDALRHARERLQSSIEKSVLI